MEGGTRERAVKGRSVIGSLARVMRWKEEQECTGIIKDGPLVVTSVYSVKVSTCNMLPQ